MLRTMFLCFLAQGVLALVSYFPRYGDFPFRKKVSRMENCCLRLSPRLAVKHLQIDVNIDQETYNILLNIFP